MLIRLTLWFLLSLALGLAGRPVAAQDLITERAVFEEPQGAITWPELEGVAFSPAASIISRGYTPAVLWVRLTVDAPLDARRLALRVFPAQLGEVRVFHPLLPREGQRVLGRTVWVEVRPGLNAFYLRIKTSGPMLLEPRLLSEAQAQDEDVLRGFFSGLVLACCALLMVWLLVLTLTRRQLLHPVFLLNLSIVVLLAFAWAGYLPNLLSLTAIYFLGVVNIFTGFLCTWLVFKRFGVPRWGERLLMFLGVLYLPLFVLFFVLDRQPVLRVSTALGLIACLACLPLTVAVFCRQKRSSWVIGVFLFLALALGLRWFLTLHVDLLPMDSLTSLLFFRIFFAMGFVAATLVLLDREKQTQLQISLMNEAMTRQRAESETQRRETQERFMIMLMHELKTPLAIIQLAASSLGRRLAPDSGDATRIKNINRSVDDLNALVERCASADQIDQGAMHMDKRPLCLAALVNDVLQTVGADRISLQGELQHTVTTDAQYLRLILLNLLSNALKYSPPQSRIGLHVEPASHPDRRGVTVRVVNAVGSAGVPDGAHVFERYYRSEGARRLVGAGLGLWLAQALARQLGSGLVFQADPQTVVFSLFLESA